jgi:hypothetical protein
MENMLWIEDIVESTTITTLIFTNYKIGIIPFVNPYKVIIRRSASSTFPNA